MSSGNWINISLKGKKLEFKSTLGIPTQTESQRIIYIIPILDYFLENRLVNATELEHALPISRDSIDRIIQLLVKYKMIKLEQILLKNKKFYTLKNKRLAELYQNKLLQWLWIKEMKQDRKSMLKLEIMLNSTKNIGKQAQHIFKKNIASTRKTTDILYRPLIIETPINKNSNPILIRDLPISKARKIIKDYLNGKFCKVCLKKNRLSLLHTDLEGVEEGCNYGHISNYRNVNDM
jgi:hypothetical protein